MKTLVFGGSFDPPHSGHAALLSAAAESVRPERILVVPAYQSPLKGAHGAPAEARAQLVLRGLMARLPRHWSRIARVDLSEARSPRKSFTIDTLRRLKKADPKGELHFVCGQDSAAEFPRWKEPRALRKLARWWYGPRAGAAGAPPAFFRRIPARLPDVSSTELRAALAAGRDCSDAIAPDVMAEIERRGLYGRALLKRLRETLRPVRYEHTLNVATLAEALARRHGADPEKARLAGLLHDCGRRFVPALMAAHVRRRRLNAPLRERTARLEPMLLHAYVSEDLARREFGVEDAQVLSAIRKHTLGDRRMSLLDRVVYVADACSADRAHPGAAKTRALAFRDLDAAFAHCVGEKLRHAIERGAWLHPRTVELWNSLAAR